MENITGRTSAAVKTIINFALKHSTLIVRASIVIVIQSGVK